MDRAKGEPFPGVFLIHGQEMLVEQSAERLLASLLDGASRDLCCEVMEGHVERIPDLLAQMNTFSLLSGPKIRLFKEAKLFEGRRNDQRLVEQIIEACEGEDLNQAAKMLVNLCGRLEMDLEAVPQSLSGNETLSLLHGSLGSEGVEKVAQYAIAQGWRPTGAGNQVETLQAAIEKGFANHHHLIITVNARVPKNLKFYKSIRDNGWIIDCNVPVGERRADRMAQEGVLRQTLETALTASGKRLQAGLFEPLCRLTGFDMRTFAQNVEKLIDYTGGRTEITLDDVNKVLRRTKSDPIFELTNAVADRNLKQALFYLHTLLAGQWYPLQILAALTNQVRKLTIAKDFTMSGPGKHWRNGMSYQQFQHSVMPAIEAFDNQVRESANQWQEIAREDKKDKKGKSGATKANHDILVAPNPNNPYPIYQTLLKSEKYTQKELLWAMDVLNQTDVRLKSTGQNTAIVLEKSIMEICGSSSA